MTRRSLTMVGLAISLLSVSGQVTLSQQQTPPQERQTLPQERRAWEYVHPEMRPVSNREFIEKALESGLVEVEIGRAAAKFGESREVRMFGERMMEDHERANAQLRQLAKEKGFEAPSSMNDESRKKANRFTSMTWTSFDRAYMECMIKDHEKKIAKFERISRESDDPAVKQWAEKMLPTLRDHLKHAREVAREVGAIDLNMEP